jgi:hypothetical protein
MKGEINREWYCSAGLRGDDNSVSCYDADSFRHGYDPCSSECPAYHRKWPTPRQFREEYGEEYPDDGLVYYRKEKYTESCEWYGGVYWKLKANPLNEPIVCACTPWSCPPKDWRPE